MREGSAERRQGWVVPMLLCALAVVLMRATVWGGDHNDGVLRLVEVLRDGVRGVEGLVQPPGIVISPDGAHAYVAVAGSNAVTAFARDPASGRLTLLQVQDGGLDEIPGAAPYDLAVSPDGANVYVAAFSGNAVAVFARDPGSGRLTFVEAQRQGVAGVDGLLWARSVAVSPDSRHVYTAAVLSGAVAVFAREASTGELTFVEVHRQGVGGVDGLAWAHSVTVSPDGAHVYAAGSVSGAVAVFGRDAGTGRLTFIGIHGQGTCDVDRLGGVAAVTVSPDGEHVYAVTRDSSTLAFFTRDRAGGRLTCVETHRDDCTAGPGAVGVCGAEAVAVSPDGVHVYTADQDGRALGVFARNAQTGTLTPLEVERQGKFGVDGLTEPLWVAVSPDGRHVYVASRGDEPGATQAVGEGAVAVFEIAPPSSDDDGCAIKRTGAPRRAAAVVLLLPLALLFVGGCLTKVAVATESFAPGGALPTQRRRASGGRWRSRVACPLFLFAFSSLREELFPPARTDRYGQHGNCDRAALVRFVLWLSAGRNEAAVYVLTGAQWRARWSAPREVTIASPRKVAIGLDVVSVQSGNSPAKGVIMCGTRTRRP